MLKILKEKLDLGLGLLRRAETCPNSHNCLWLNRAHLSETKYFLQTRWCQKENCPIVVFRKDFESDSPAFYAESLRLSQFENVVKTREAINKETGYVKQKRWINSKKRAHDLHVFGQLLIIGLYPLYLETKEIPFLKTQEIKSVRRNYCDSSDLKVMMKMKEINLEWLQRLKAVAKKLVINRTYPKDIFYLIHLFFEGLKKNELPDIGAISKEEREEFFKMIEKAICL